MKNEVAKQAGGKLAATCYIKYLVVDDIFMKNISILLWQREEERIVASCLSMSRRPSLARALAFLGGGILAAQGI